MMAKTWGLVALLALAATAAGQADPPPVPLIESRVATFFAGESAETLTRRRYEEVEILGRLLDRAVGRLPGVAAHQAVHGLASVAFSPDGKRLATSEPYSVRLWDAAKGKGVHDYPGLAGTSLAQGTYLKGHGVVYALGLPGYVGPVVSDGAKSRGGSALTDWERARRELAGQKVEDKAKASEDVSLADALLGVLAANGKNFTQLPGNESVTVAVTLAGSQTSCLSCHTAATAAVPMKIKVVAPPPGNTGGGGSATASENARRPELLGDLHLKQGEHDKAVAAYRTALAAAGSQNADVADLKVMEVAVKLAQALAAQGKADESRRVLSDLAAMAGKATKAPPPPASGTTPGTMALPPRLLVTAPKAALDAVGSGKMSFEEFRKAARVEHLTFPAPADGDKPVPPAPASVSP